MAATVLRRDTSSGDAPRLQDRRFPAPSQVQTTIDSVLVLLRDGLLLSEITTGRKCTSRSRRRKPPRRVRTDAVLSEHRMKHLSEVSGQNHLQGSSLN